MAVKSVPEGYHTVTPDLTAPTMRRACSSSSKRRSVRESTAMPSQLYLYVPDCDAVYRHALAAGATSVHEPKTQFYGDRHGCVRDAWGNLWWAASHVEDVSNDELERRAAAAMQAS